MLYFRKDHRVKVLKRLTDLQLLMMAFLVLKLEKKNTLKQLNLVYVFRYFSAAFAIIEALFASQPTAFS